MSITIYGIKNCDTMKKARAWLDKHGIDYAFHDYKTAGIEREQLERWEKKVGWETLLNRAGTTFRKLPDKDKQVNDARKAIADGTTKNAILRRPSFNRARSASRAGASAPPCAAIAGSSAAATDMPNRLTGSVYSNCAFAMPVTAPVGSRLAMRVSMKALI